MSPPRYFLRNMESSENVKFIGGVTLIRYILSTYVDSMYRSGPYVDSNNA